MGASEMSIVSPYLPRISYYPLQGGDDPHVPARARAERRQRFAIGCAVIKSGGLVHAVEAHQHGQLALARLVDVARLRPGDQRSAKLLNGPPPQCAGGAE